LKTKRRRRKTFHFALRLANNPAHPGNELFEYVADNIWSNHNGVSSSHHVVSIHFSQLANSFIEAVHSAILAIEAIPGLFVECIEHDDYVSISEIAERTNRSRETVRLWTASRRRSGGFPKVPEGFGGRHKFWLWSDVLEWLLAQGLIESAELEYARATEAINTALAMRRSCAKLTPEDRKIVLTLARGAVRTELAASA
jgi:predicted DNA-binding transcriptional regulator AlpA